MRFFLKGGNGIVTMLKKEPLSFFFETHTEIFTTEIIGSLGLASKQSGGGGDELDTWS